MGTALLQGWLANKISPIVVVEPEPSLSLRRLERKHKFVLTTTMSGIPQNDIKTCVVAIKPQVLKNTARSLINIAMNEATMISIAAGTTTKFLRQAWGERAHIVRAMPNTPGAIGKGITGLFAATGTTARDRDCAEVLLSALGEVLWVGSENEIDAVTALSGSGPAYVFHLVEAMTKAGISVGLSGLEAEKLARATVVGAGALLATEDDSAAGLRMAVASPGGTTEAALKVLMPELTGLMTRTIKAAKKRAEELR